MSAEWKKCSNGHYYQGGSCPYCSNFKNGDNRTEVFMGETERTDTVDAEEEGHGTKTSIVDSTIIDDLHIPTSSGGRKPFPSRTVFGDDFGDEGCGPKVNSDRSVVPPYRVERKLVGWLISYTWDCCGTDYRLYEGRNIIGRDGSCQISIEDGKISSVHAVILFRSGKFSITDQQSSHGTYINGEDIELEPRYLKDGDMIKIGNTELKFRSAL